MDAVFIWVSCYNHEKWKDLIYKIINIKKLQGQDTIMAHCNMLWNTNRTCTYSSCVHFIAMVSDHGGGALIGTVARTTKSKNGKT